MGSGDFQTFSAIGYLFARGLQAALAPLFPQLPIGVISANWGGTCLSSWVPEDGAAAACGQTGTSGSFNLYNGLIAPLTHGPITIAGILFSQGECDADCNNTAYYACAFPKFIDDWRTRFASGAGDFAETFFGFQVLPAYVNDSGRFNPYSLPFERAAQLTGLRAPGAVYAANSIDLGDATAPHGSVHPRHKQAVAARLVAAALALVYDVPTPYLAPAYARADAVVDAAGATVTISFANATGNCGALELRDAACPVGVGGLPLSECAWFDIQDEAGVWHNATGVALSAASTQLVLTVPRFAGAVNATRGYWSPWPVVGLFSVEGFPALPWWAAVDSSTAGR